eukprot:IDg56t1
MTSMPNEHCHDNQPIFPATPGARVSRALILILNSLRLDGVLCEQAVSPPPARNGQTWCRQQPPRASVGFLDTTHGRLLTTVEAMAAVQEKEELNTMKRAAQAERKAQAELKEQIQRARIQTACLAGENAALRWRAQRFGLDLSQMKPTRPMRERRAAARARVAKKNPLL